MKRKGIDKNLHPELLGAILLSEYQVAELLSMSVATIRRWRHIKEGPPYIKLGSSVRYHAETLLTWVKNHSIVS